MSVRPVPGSLVGVVVAVEVRRGVLSEAAMAAAVAGSAGCGRF